MHINTLPHTFLQIFKEIEPKLPQMKESEKHIYSGQSLWTQWLVYLFCACSLVRRTEAGVSHCPNSNFSLKSGVCDVRRLRAAGVKVFVCIC
jgi:hypothetical protein